MVHARERLFRQFFVAMPPRARAAFYLGVFCCFAPIGLLQGVMTLSADPWWVVALVTGFSGGIAIAYVWTLMRQPRWFPVLVALHVAGALAMGRGLPSAPRPEALDLAGMVSIRQRLAVLVMLTCASTVLAYIAFLVLIRREGLRFSSAHAEIRLACGIHAALVPPVEGRTPALAWRGRSQPSGDVGGDLVDVVQRGGTVHASVADVSGHGVAAGVFMGMYKAALRTGLNEDVDPGVLVTRLNRVVGALREPHMFITAALLRVTGDGTVDYVLAGHPQMLHVPAGRSSSTWIGESQAALGLMDTLEYRTGRLALESGDHLLVVTDGLLEVFDRRDRELGPAGIQAAVESAVRQGADLAGIERAVFEQCRIHGTQLDDQTVLVLRRL